MAFKSGVSGNPAGRPPSSPAIQSLARRKAQLAVQTLTEIAEDISAPASARVEAALGLLSFGQITKTRPVSNTEA